MVDPGIENTVKGYLRAVRNAGIATDEAVLFGSHARGDAHEWSDIDIVVLIPEFDHNRDHRLVRKLWSLRAKTDSRIEPIACGVREWEENEDRMILEYARQGVHIYL